MLPILDTLGRWRTYQQGDIPFGQHKLFHLDFDPPVVLHIEMTVKLAYLLANGVLV